MKFRAFTALSLLLFYAISASFAATGHSGGANAQAGPSTPSSVETVANGVSGGQTIRSLPLELLTVNDIEVAGIANVVSNVAGNSRNAVAGPAAVARKLVSREDLAFALAQQFDYPYLSQGDTSLSTDLVAAYKPFSHAGETLRAVRSQLRLRWLNTARSRKVLAVVSPASGEGRSFVAANLAIVFAQHGERTLLIDGDLRSAHQQELFRLQKTAGLSGILAGRADLRAAMVVAGLPGLIVLPSGPVPPNPQELLGRVAFTALLQASIQQFDVIIIDTPSADEFADAEIIAANAGAALMVARKNKTVLPKSAQLARRLQTNGVDVIGSVLNDA